MDWLRTWRKRSSERRRSARFALRCPAKIEVGQQPYAGYIEDISETGARLRTVSRLATLGVVSLKLPGLPDITGRVRWTDSHSAGIRFDAELPKAQLARWIRRNLGLRDAVDCEIAKLFHLPRCGAEAMPRATSEIWR